MLLLLLFFFLMTQKRKRAVLFFIKAEPVQHVSYHRIRQIGILLRKDEEPCDEEGVESLLIQGSEVCVKLMLCREVSRFCIAHAEGWHRRQRGNCQGIKTAGPVIRSLRKGRESERDGLVGDACVDEA